MKRLFWTLSLLAIAAWVGACTPEGPAQNNPDPNGTTNPPPTRRVEPRVEPPTQRVEPPTTPTKPRVQPPPSVRDHWSQTNPSGETTGTIHPSFGREGRRVSVLQLRTMIPRLFNGITWTAGNANMFDRLSRTLGQADYLQVTFSTRDSTSLFMKFMDDMAGQVCKAAVQKDLNTQDLSKRSVVRYNDVNKTLRFLRLKFHSIYVPDGSMEGVQQLRTLYDRVLAKTKKTSTAWEGVCIAVLTAPEFFAY